MDAFKRFLWLLAACFIGSSGCSPEPGLVTTPAGLVVRYEPLEIYPTATTVRLMIQDYGDGEGAAGEDRQRILLTAGERARLEAAFRKAVIVRRLPPDPDRSGAVAAACFVPHHFFEYLDGNGAVLGTVEVCFCCTGARFGPAVVPEGPDVYIEEDIDAVKTLMKDMGLPTDLGC